MILRLRRKRKSCYGMESSTLVSKIKRGDLYRLDWTPGRGSEQTGIRPALVIQYDSGNNSPRYTNTIVVAVSSQAKPAPFHVEIKPDVGNGLATVSFVKCEQVITVSKDRLTEYIGRLSASDMEAVDDALKGVLDLP